MCYWFSYDFTFHKLKTPNQSLWIDKALWMEGETIFKNIKKKSLFSLIQTFKSYHLDDWESTQLMEKKTEEPLMGET